MRNPIWRVVAGLVVLCAAGCGMNSSDGVYPNRPINLIVPFSAGGGTDTYARVFKKAIDDEGLLPQPFVIVNIDGAGATIGSRRAKDAKPDGYTVLLLHDAILTAKASGTVDYGPEAFEPVAGTGEVGMVIAVWEDSPYHDLDQLMNAAIDSPRTLKFGANIGALTHYAGLQLEDAAWDKAGRDKDDRESLFLFAQIGGGSKRFADLKGGHIDVTGFSLEEFLRFRSEGLRGLAYFGKERHAAIKNVETGAEQGYQIVHKNTFYWWVPKGTPQDRIDVLVKTLDEARNTEFVEEKMREMHTESLLITGSKLQERLEESEQQYADVSTRQTTKLPNIPLLVGIATATLFVLTIAWSQMTKRRQPAHAPTKTVAAPRVVGRRRTAAWGVLVTVGYVGVLSLGWPGYLWATIAYLVAIGAVLTRGKRRLLPLVALASVVISTAVFWVFTQQFDVGLP